WQLCTLLLVFVVVLALTQPFLPALPGLAVLAVLLVLSGVALWHGARDLHGHVRAGAQAIAEVLAAQGAPGEDEPAPAGSGAEPLGRLQDALPGIGSL